MKSSILKSMVKSNRGMTLVEVMVGMVVFAIGILGLSQVTFRVMHSNLQSKHTVIATNLAHQRMEQVLSSMRYNSINQTNFPSEDYGQVNGGDQNYKNFKRTVAIADSVNSLGNSILKEITVRVEWKDSGKTRHVELRSSISRFKDINM